FGEATCVLERLHRLALLLGELEALPRERNHTARWLLERTADDLRRLRRRHAEAHRLVDRELQRLREALAGDRRVREQARLRLDDLVRRVNCALADIVRHAHELL